MKTLTLVDPHVMASNIAESERLLGFVCDTIVENEVDRIVLTGDLMHNFSVLRVEVVNFWSKWLEKLSSICEVFVLVGNHDKKNQSNDDDLENALDIYNFIGNPKLHIVQHPIAFGAFGFIPYIHDKAKFVEAANELCSQGCKVLYTHAEYDGSKYESGMFIPDGIKPEEINCDLIINGHIHSRQRFGKVIMPGTARWLNSSDKNEPKGLWLAEHDPKTGAILSEQFLDTSHVCVPIYAYQYKEGEAEPVIPEGSRASVELIGTSEWVQKQKVKFRGKASVSSKITDKSRPKNRKSGHNLAHFVDNVFEPTQGMKKERLISFMKELGVL
jgi:predicted phosphodiesterase